MDIVKLWGLTPSVDLIAYRRVQRTDHAPAISATAFTSNVNIYIYMRDVMRNDYCLTKIIVHMVGL